LLGVVVRRWLFVIRFTSFVKSKRRTQKTNNPSF
jgi:hypothetical protein